MSSCWGLDTKNMPKAHRNMSPAAVAGAPENAKMSASVMQPMAWPAAAILPGDVRSVSRPPTSEPTTMPKPASASSAGSASDGKPPMSVSHGDT